MSFEKTNHPSQPNPCNPEYSDIDESRKISTQEYVDTVLLPQSNTSNQVIPLLRAEYGVKYINNRAVTTNIRTQLTDRKLTCTKCSGYFSWYMYNGHTSTCKYAPGSCKYCGYQRPTYLIGFPHKKGCIGIDGIYHMCETSYMKQKE
jgi:predicted metal-binding protein